MEGSKFALPLYEQRLEKALSLGPFLDQVEEVMNDTDSESDEDSSDSESIYAEYLKNGLPRTEEGKREDQSLMYNFSSVKKKRLWLKDVLLSSSEEEDSEKELSDSDLQDMLWEHKLKKKYQSQFHLKKEKKKYMYYSAGLLSRVDRYHEHQKYLTGNKKKRTKVIRDKEIKTEVVKEELDEDSKQGLQFLKKAIKEEPLSDALDDSSEELVVNIKPKSKANKKDKKSKKLDAQALAIRRHKLWVLMSKKEVVRCQKSKLSFRKEMLQNCKKMATGCMRYCRHKALQSQKTMKDKMWLLKRLTRTMQNEWKKYDRIIKEQSKRAEKEAEEQRKIDKEIIEAKRQQRKVNFLITLPELYTHFMKNKIAAAEGSEMADDAGVDEKTRSILKQLDEVKPLPASVDDDYDSESMKNQALHTVQEAYSSHFGKGAAPPNMSAPKEHGQPKGFVGQLKSYQLKGMNWLANLYYFGINGILADEMGLGKTVQSVAFLAHIGEEYDTWGPFIIVTPASTLHNWTCEIARFVPSLKVVPYWGNPEERKSLRKFFDGKGIGTKDSSFHVVVTSYQIVIQDFKFLNRLKWNYMVLDEAQAIKSINSQRWKQLLGFNCRNRLLLSGTPIQNSMAELWALLHFIMPTLFDSHCWFNEWFSKDIEGHVENRTTVDEKHLNRLHMILKPFMLRRVKSEVENELSDKIEIMMYCPLTLRQNSLYSGLKNKIVIDELLGTSSSSSSSFQSVTTSLMNLVMQFRKVCNHPELLERREVRSPYTVYPEPYLLPKLIYREGIIENGFSSRKHLLHNRLSIYNPAYIHSTLKSTLDCPVNQNELNSFSFLKFSGMSVGEVSRFALEGYLVRYIYILSNFRDQILRYLRKLWGDRGSTCLGHDSLLLGGSSPLCEPLLRTSPVLSSLVFTSYSSLVYGFNEHVIHSVPETKPHRLIRLRKQRNRSLVQDINLDTEIKTEFNSSSVLNYQEGKPVAMATHFPGNPAKDASNPEVPKPNSYSRSPRKTAFKVKKEVKIEDDCLLSSGDTPGRPEFTYIERDPIRRRCQPTAVPTFIMHTCPKVHCMSREMYVFDRSAASFSLNSSNLFNSDRSTLLYGSTKLEEEWRSRNTRIQSPETGGAWALSPPLGWNKIVIPDKHTLIMDAGKLYVLDTLLQRLKTGNHRVLVYSQMTKMIDILEDYMWHRKHKYMRLDGSSKIAERRDMVEDFQNKSDIFVFLLSTRAGGVGINLTAADTVIFYDSDWNPTVDQQAMDRAHRLGQTKQVTVYRLICKGTIEERILERAREKSEIQRMVISGGNFKPDTLKPKEVVSLLLDADIEREFRAKQAERKSLEDQKTEINRERLRERMRKRYMEKKWEKEKVVKRRKLDEDLGEIDVCGDTGPPDSGSPSSPALSEDSLGMPPVSFTDDANGDALHVDVETHTPSQSISVSPFSLKGSDNRGNSPIRRHRRRGRPPGSGSRGRAPRTAESGTSTQIPNGPSHDPVQAAPGGENPSTSNTPKRGRGRPRLLPLGPGNQGTRTPPALPVALGSTLGSNLSSSNLNKKSKNSFYQRNS